MNAFERQFAGDHRFHVRVFPEKGSSSQATRYYTSLVAAEQAQSHTIDGYPGIEAVPVGESAATREVDCCSAAIVYGEVGSSHWIFGHIESGRGFPDLQPLRDVQGGIVGRANLILIGASPMDTISISEEDRKARRLQVNRVLQQVNACHISLLRENIRLYWNNELHTYIDIVAGVGKNGLERAHITHVRL